MQHTREAPKARCFLPRLEKQSFTSGHGTADVCVATGPRTTFGGVAAFVAGGIPVDGTVGTHMACGVRATRERPKVVISHVSATGVGDGASSKPSAVHQAKLERTCTILATGEA